MNDECEDNCPSIMGGSCACENETKEKCVSCPSTDDLYALREDGYLAGAFEVYVDWICGTCFFQPYGGLELTTKENK